jgi:hypothetical protein
MLSSVATVASVNVRAGGADVTQLRHISCTRHRVSPGITIEG